MREGEVAAEGATGVVGASGASGGAARVLRAGFHVGLALWAFVLTGQLIDWLVPLHVPLLSMKWAHFLAHRDSYTTVYLGTSVVRHHIVPQVVDAEMRARGIPEHSFNLGIGHMTYTEARLLVERLIALRPKRLKRVVLDAHLFLDPDEGNDLSPRHLWWHTPGETFALLDRIYHWKGARATRDARLRVEAQAMLILLTAAGRVAEEFRAGWDAGLRVPDEDDAPVIDEGYRALETLNARPVLRQRRQLRRDPAYYERQVKVRARYWRTRKLAKRERAAMDDLVRRVVHAGWQPVVLETASLRPRFEFSATVRRHAIVLSFNDPDKYAELYETAVRHDYNHLNNAGARAASLLLGDAFAAALGAAAREPKKKQPPPSPPRGTPDDPEPG